jgi:phage FluMu gp28-like protein
VDVGRDHDLTVLWLCERVGDVFFTRAVDCLENQTFDAQERALYAWLERPEVRRCCIDATGLGRQFAERAQQRFGPARVEAIHFTAVVKEELAGIVRAAFERRAVRIPNEPFVRADLRAIKKETTAAGNIRFTADRGRNGHADRFWALALALHAGQTGHAAGPIHVFPDTAWGRALEQRRERSVGG